MLTVFVCIWRVSTSSTRVKLTLLTLVAIAGIVTFLQKLKYKNSAPISSQK